MSKKILAAYFSASGTTALIAKNLVAEWERPMRNWKRAAPVQSC